MPSTYDLIDGTTVDGDMASICYMLDAYDPLSDDLKMTLTDEQTLVEFIEWRPDCRWCPDTRSLIVSNGQDSFIQIRGDERLYELLRIFNRGRLLWANNEIASSAGDDTSRIGPAKAYLKHVTAATKGSALKAVVSTFCKTRTIRSSELDREPTVIGTRVGVVDMDKGRLLTDLEGYEDAGQQWNVTKCCRGEIESRFNQAPNYDERWDEFVSEIMCGDEEKVDYLQRALGYSMLGANPEECMFIAYGATTRNGKGTLLNTIAWVLGDYAGNMPSDFLTRRRGGIQSNHDDALGALEGARFVTMSEPTAGQKLDESKVKSLTGNDPITVSRKYCPTVTFNPQFTMWLSCNRLPAVDDTSVFTSGRIRVIPFERHFDRDEQDKTLKDRFCSEDGAYTVLTWLLEGYEKWKERGLDEPDSIRESTANFANSGGDDFQRFLDEECVIETEAKVRVNELVKAFKEWCEENDCDALQQRVVTQRLKDMGIPSRKGAKGYFYFYGIGLKK